MRDSPSYAQNALVSNENPRSLSLRYQLQGPFCFPLLCNIMRSVVSIHAAVAEDCMASPGHHLRRGPWGVERAWRM